MPAGKVEAAAGIRSAANGDAAPDLPGEAVETPCFVIYEDRVLHNIRQTVAAAGGTSRLLPHVKTHRAPWLVHLQIAEGIRSFKAATLAEIEMCLESGAEEVTWAYPTANPANVRRFLEYSVRYPNARLVGMVDSNEGLRRWLEQLSSAPPNVILRVDLDPGFGRTGLPLSTELLAAARALSAVGRFAGWHVYDGHIKGDRASRRDQVAAVAGDLSALLAEAAKESIVGDVVAGGSYTFDLWPHEVARRVTPGSWIFSSAEHDADLPELNLRPAAFVLATVISERAGTVTLDAGSKAISPDKPFAERFRWPGHIRLMSEEHTVADQPLALGVGQRVLLMPMHACTTAYLYDEALVKTVSGRWERRAQLGCVRHQLREKGTAGGKRTPA